MNRLTRFRRDLHQIPELDLDLKKTQSYIVNALSTLPCKLSMPIKGSVIAYFDANKNNSIAFRCDMDALSIQEKTKHSFVSKHEGNMHACGHDGHMAIMLEFAYQLTEYYLELPHNVVLIFQPGEESVGGAKLLCETGFINKYHIQAIFGIHLWPFLEKGKIVTRKKEMMASAKEVKIDVYGKSSHIAQYQKGIDAMYYAMNIIQDLYVYVEKEIPEEEGLLRFGVFQSGTMRNIVSNHTLIEGSLRYFHEETYEKIKRFTDEIIIKYKQKGVLIKINYSEGYPTVINDEKLVEWIQDILPEVGILHEAQMTAEDFSFYQKAIPGVFFFLGTGSSIPLHSDIFNFDEEVLVHGVELYKAISKKKKTALGC